MRSIAHVPHALDAMRRLEAESEKWQEPVRLAKPLLEHHVTSKLALLKPPTRPSCVPSRIAATNNCKLEVKVLQKHVLLHENQKTRLRVDGQLSGCVARHSQAYHSSLTPSEHSARVGHLAVVTRKHMSFSPLHLLHHFTLPAQIACCYLAQRRIRRLGGQIPRP
ncbi:hypothetical protein GQ44DRAFT_708374 [Phaeosphaeriaceae sp. PMI808]|nr:hypothetical protein GQ44DRAFT_708374 [Phaeosphaeriaceae sp. PMI808]